jgi:tryptophanase
MTGQPVPRSRRFRRSSIPARALAVALYEAGGVRSCEIRTVMFGRRPGR